MKFYLIQIITLSFFIISCSSSSSEKRVNTNSNPGLEKLASKKYELSYADLSVDLPFQDEHFRGLDINGNKAIITGSKGTVIQYNFGVNNDTNFSLSTQNINLHFRDADASLKHDLYMAIQNPSQVLKKYQDSVSIVYVNKDSTCFLDGIDFWDNGLGILFGDPMHGEHFILKSLDDGSSWNSIPKENIPTPIKNEAGFAASGTSVVCVGKGIGYIGWGGDEVRIFKTNDYGNNWTPQTTPMPKHQSGTGIYAMSFKDELNGVAVGGNWEFPECDSSKIYTNDGGITWNLSSGVQGYRSCVTYVKEDIYISTGTNGTDISNDGGRTWELLDTLGFNAIQFIKSQEIKCLGVGNYGLIKILEIKE